MIDVAGQDQRAISGPLIPVTSGLSRSLADTQPRRSGHVTGPDGTASQADSAGSIPVTRSIKSHFIHNFRATARFDCRLVASSGL